ncbi:MAG: (2Fe-2S) ferredoxin domain-containing protein [Oscillospiraceae bacterium]
MMRITVCIGSACHVKGSRNVVEELQYLIAENNSKDKIELSGAFCVNECNKPGVCVTIDGTKFDVNPKEIHKFFDEEILAKI